MNNRRHPISDNNSVSGEPRRQNVGANHELFAERSAPATRNDPPSPHADEKCETTLAERHDATQTAANDQHQLATPPRGVSFDPDAKSNKNTNIVHVVDLTPASALNAGGEKAAGAEDASLASSTTTTASSAKRTTTDDEKCAPKCWRWLLTPMHTIECAQTAGADAFCRRADGLQLGVWVALALGYHAFLAMALSHDFAKANNLFAVTLVAWALAAYSLLLRPYLATSASVQTQLAKVMKNKRVMSIFKGCFYIKLVLWPACFILWDAWGSYERLSGLVGLACFFVFMCVCSYKPTKVNWRPVIWGFLLQFLFGIAVLRWEWGSARFVDLSNTMIAFLDFSRNGTDFTYGFLSAPLNICGMEPVLAFQTLQTVIYFGAVVALLYFYGVIQALLKRMAWLMQATLGTTATESLNACACVLLGNAESPMLIRPYLEKMTASELHAVMTTGFACIAGAVFAAYISFGACPRYLLSAAVMSAPGSLACAKLLYPETEQSQCCTVEELDLPATDEKNPLESISNGSMLGAHLVVSIIANLIVFMALMALFDGILGYFGDLIGHPGWTVETALSYVFYPVAYMMGVTASNDETFIVARLLGVKVVVNDFIAYKRLGEFLAQDALSPRSAMIATYALCSFSNFIAAGIQLAVLGGMAPNRKPLLSKLVLRALLAGSISCFMSASLAGVLVSDPVGCRPRTEHVGARCFNLTEHQHFLDTFLAHQRNNNILSSSPSTLSPFPIIAR